MVDLSTREYVFLRINYLLRPSATKSKIARNLKSEKNDCIWLDKKIG